MVPEEAEWFLINVAEYCRHGTKPEASPTFAEMTRTIATLTADLTAMRDELTERDEAVQALLEDLKAGQGTTLSPQRLGYRQVIRRVRELVKAHVPLSATLAVVSKGDDELFRHRGYQGWHFPQDERGTYAGYYPACSLAAIAHLEVLKARGATHFLIPELAAWWLTTYPEFRQHLECRYQLLVRQDGAGLIYSLTPAAAATNSHSTPGDFVTRFQTAFGRSPQVLNWNGGDAAADYFAKATLFAPPSANGVLPYVDQSVDVVAVNATKPGMLAEARRVAEIAVVDFADDARIDWVRELPTLQLPSVSIVIPVFNQLRLTDSCLKAPLGDSSTELRGGSDRGE
ncbi:hypothetical protein BH11PLA2_BH11PLA2_17590 [soil metagenome]